MTSVTSWRSDTSWIVVALFQKCIIVIIIIAVIIIIFLFRVVPMTYGSCWARG